MAAPASPAASNAARKPRRLRRTQGIGIGLLLTIVGLALVSLLLPTAPARFGYALPIAGAGILAVWIGGILMGIGSRS